MHRESSGCCVGQCHNRQGNDHDCQDDVRDQHGVVDRADRTLAAERSVNPAHQDLVYHVSDEKEAGHCECGDHARPMGGYALLLDE
jgi:hypothetical protein